MRLAALGPALVPLLAGCFGMCGFMPDSADWTDPALFDAMPAPGTTPDGVAAVWTDPRPGLPFATIVDPAWGPHNLTTVHRQSLAARAEGPRITLEAGRLSMSHDNRTPTSEARPALHAFLANVTTLDDAARTRYVDAILANATSGAQYPEYRDDGTLTRLHSVSYEGPEPDGLDLDRLWADLDAVGALDVGRGGAVAGPWSFGFSLASRELVGHDGRLTVDPTGEARFEGLGDGEQPEEDYEADVRAWLASHGLPQPDLMHLGGSIC